MKFANFFTKTKEFLFRRLSELLGLLIVFLSLSILISLVSYSPNDPNFIISEADEIQNLMKTDNHFFKHVSNSANKIRKLAEKYS